MSCELRRADKTMVPVVALIIGGLEEETTGVEEEVTECEQQPVPGIGRR